MTKIRPNISVDKDVWKYWKSRPGVNVSGMINSFLKEEMKLEVADEER